MLKQILQGIAVVFAVILLLAGFFSMNIAFVAGKFLQDGKQLEDAAIKEVDAFVDEKYDALKSNHTDINISKEEAKERLHAGIRETPTGQEETIKSLRAGVSGIKATSAVILAMGLLFMALGTFSLTAFFRKTGIVGVIASIANMAAYFVIGRAVPLLLEGFGRRAEASLSEQLGSELSRRIFEAALKVIVNYGLVVSGIMLLAFLMMVIVEFILRKRPFENRKVYI